MTRTTTTTSTSSPAHVARVEQLIASMSIEEKVARATASGSARVVRAVMSPRISTTSAATSIWMPCSRTGWDSSPARSAPCLLFRPRCSLLRAQERIVRAGRHGIPAMSHEECLAGFAAWGATAYPVPLS